jgi:dihydropteroate synthase
MKKYRFSPGNQQIMGILNITPDSFSDGGQFFAPAVATAKALALEQQGADILDLGAQSTRPGHAPIGAEEELRRLLPVLEALKGRIAIPVSIDTYYPAVADAVLSLGAQIINDVSGAVSREMAEVVRQHSACWVLMHNGGGSDAFPRYEPDVITCVHKALADMARQALALDLEPTQICLDPGIGFGKTQEDNLRLLARTSEVKVDGFAYLVGASRKRVTAYGGNGCPPQERLGGTIAAHTLAQWGGADILRAHDVREAKQASQMLDICKKNL